MSKSTKRKTPGRKNEKPVSLSHLGEDFETVVKTVLKSPPMPKKKRTSKKKPKDK